MSGSQQLTDVTNCARCGQNHEQVVFTSLTQPMEDSAGVVWDMWAPCPTTGEPILMRMVELPAWPLEVPE